MITEPLPGALLTSLEGTLFRKQWGEGKEGHACANGVDDFLNAGLGACTEKVPAWRSPGGACV